MLPENMMKWGKSRSCIRELMEYGVGRKKEIGADKVFDFSLGNPSVPSPKEVNEAISELAAESDISLHAYTTAAGLVTLREKIAADLRKRYEIPVSAGHMYITCGAAASLTISLNATVVDGDEVIIMAPFFPEYRVFIEAAGGTVVPVEPRADLMMDIELVKNAISEKTKAVIINTPNNPSGVLYDRENITALADLLRETEERYGHSVYLISDEPYRELVYSDAEVVSPLGLYDDSIMCYSFSKSMSLPGERIGYIAVNDNMKDVDDVYACVLGAGRALGFVNAPAMFQRVIEKTLGCYSDVSAYRNNRDILCSMLDELGYEYVSPDGAFYLFVKALESDAKAFSEKAKKHELLLVPSDDFGVGGYIRIAYCVSEKVIRDSKPAFEALMKEYRG